MIPLSLPQALGDIQIALSVLQGSDDDTDINPIDKQYNQLHCDITPLASDDEMTDIIKKLVNNYYVP